MVYAALAPQRKSIPALQPSNAPPAKRPQPSTEVTAPQSGVKWPWNAVVNNLSIPTAGASDATGAGKLRAQAMPLPAAKKMPVHPIVAQPSVVQQMAVTGAANSDASSGDKKGISLQAQPNRTGLPDPLKTGLEYLSGYSLDQVKVHYNSIKPAQMSAHAYTQGTDIYMGPGQERHLSHEGWHVVQQMQGRVKATRQLKGMGLNDDAGLEREANVMGEKIQAMELGSLFRSPQQRTSDQFRKGKDHATVVQRLRIDGQLKTAQDVEALVDCSESTDVWQKLIEWTQKDITSFPDWDDALFWARLALEVMETKDNLLETAAKLNLYIKTEGTQRYLKQLIESDGKGPGDQAHHQEILRYLANGILRDVEHKAWANDEKHKCRYSDALIKEKMGEARVEIKDYDRRHQQGLAIMKSFYSQFEDNLINVLMTGKSQIYVFRQGVPKWALDAMMMVYKQYSKYLGTNLRGIQGLAYNSALPAGSRTVVAFTSNIAKGGASKNGSSSASHGSGADQEFKIDPKNYGNIIDDGDELRIDDINYQVCNVPDNGDCLYATLIRLGAAALDVPALRTGIADYEDAKGNYGDTVHTARVRGRAYGTVNEDLRAFADWKGGTYIVHVYGHGAIRGELARQTIGGGEPVYHILLQGAHFRPLVKIGVSTHSQKQRITK
ncbi:MAG: DUF4157 domain-containing protein [Cyanobacteria bacterium P01_G01_bin.54]